MIPNCKIKAPFFEIGPKSYLYGQDVIDLAIAADKASEKMLEALEKNLGISLRR